MIGTSIGYCGCPEQEKPQPQPGSYHRSQETINTSTFIDSEKEFDQVVLVCVKSI